MVGASTCEAPAPAERVLVVDDEPDLRRLVAFNLRDAGFDVVEAADGTEALAAVARVRPAIVVLDLMLPDITGTEVTVHLCTQACTTATQTTDCPNPPTAGTCTPNMYCRFN